MIFRYSVDRFRSHTGNNYYFTQGQVFESLKKIYFASQLLGICSHPPRTNSNVLSDLENQKKILGKNIYLKIIKVAILNSH